MSSDKITPEFMYDALALIAGGGLGLTVIEKIFVKKQTTSEDIKSETTEEKEINS